MTSRSLAVRYASCAFLAVLMLLSVVPGARAAKDYCRKIELVGDAGGSIMNPNKPVTFFVKNEVPAIINISCPVTAENNETAIHYVKRLPYAWGNDLGDCPSPGGYDPDNPDNKTQCMDYVGGSCIVKYKVSPKDTGAKKNYAEVCCYAGPGCAGPKLGASIPITLQVQSGAPPEDCPADPNAEDADLCVVDPDPMGMQRLPTPTGAKCRAGLMSAMSSYVISTTQALVECHKARMAGKIDPSLDCNTVADADIKLTIEAAADGVVSAANTCQPLRSPSTFGFHTCPAPCNGISLGGCSAGNGAAMCQTDRDCDTAPGTGDGRCGDWGQTANCLLCVAEDAVTSTVADKYGTPSDTLPPDVQKCQNTIGVALAKLTAVRIGATAACQKKRDGGKQPLPLGAFCKDNDPSGAIAAAEQTAKDAILGNCDPSMLPQLDSICNGATTGPALGQCMVDNVRALNDAFSFAVVPSSANKCGDGVRAGFEQCDGADDNHCPGACTSRCKCGVLSPVTQSLMPCEPAVTDRYVFEVNTGDNVDLHADTTDLATASDLCFGLGSDCDTGDTIAGDDELPCTFPPSAHGCPQDNFVASGDGLCTIEVTECSGNCTNAGVGNYQLFVSRNGLPAVLQPTGDNLP